MSSGKSNNEPTLRRHCCAIIILLAFAVNKTLKYFKAFICDMGSPWHSKCDGIYEMQTRG